MAETDEVLINSTDEIHTPPTPYPRNLPMRVEAEHTLQISGDCRTNRGGGGRGVEIICIP